VGYSDSEHALSQPIENLPYLGPVRALWLRAAGITTIAELERIGHAAAYRRVRQQQAAAGANLLWVLAAGLLGRDWRELTVEEKDRLLRELEED
jgi:hypothetical protein